MMASPNSSRLPEVHTEHVADEETEQLFEEHGIINNNCDAHEQTSCPGKLYRGRLAEHVTCKRMAASLVGFVPIVNVLRHYQWRRDLLPDFVAGVSVAFLHMPMGIAIALLSSLPPIYGLYTAFFFVLIYVMFGTSPHVSLGPNALIALLVATAVDRELAKVMDSLDRQSGHSNITVPTGTTQNAPLSVLSLEEQASYKVGVATAMAMTCGAILVGLGMLRFGFLTNFLSVSFMSGFTTAAAVHIVTSQMPKLLGLHLPLHSGLAKVVLTWTDVFKNIEDINPADAVIGVISIIILLVVVGVNERYQSKMKAPVPIHLILVIVTTLISGLVGLEDKFSVAVVGHVETGFKPPAVPNTDVIGSIIVESFIIVIVGYAITISLAKLMAKKHNYDIDDNQEIVAFGLCSFIGSFFGCHPGCTAPPRVMLLSNSGSKTTLNGAFTAGFIFVIIMAAGPLFESLPVAVLAAMISAAVKNLLLQVTILPRLWRVHKPDFLIWVTTFLTSVFGDLDIGIAVGVSFSILTIIVLNMCARSSVSNVDVAKDARPRQREEDTVSNSGDILMLNGESKIDGRGLRLQGIKVFHFPTQLYFVNAEKFKKELYNKVLDPAKGDIYRQMLRIDELKSDPNQEQSCDSRWVADVEGGVNSAQVANKGQKCGAISGSVEFFAENCDQSCEKMIEETLQNGVRSEDRICRQTLDRTETTSTTDPRERCMQQNSTGQRNCEQFNFHPHTEPKHNTKVEVKAIVLDFSAVTYIDLAGVNILTSVLTEYARAGILMFLARCPKSTLDTLDKAGVLGNFPRDRILNDVQDVLCVPVVQELCPNYDV